MASLELDSFVQKLIRYVVIGVFIFALDGIGLVQPVKKTIEQGVNIISQVRRPIVDAFWIPLHWIRYYRTGTAKIVDLESRLAEAVVDRAQLAQLAKENEDMRLLLQAPLPPEWTYVVAPVLGIHADELVVGAGSAQGVVTGNTVIFEDIYIGRISKVSANQSRVILITSANSKVAAQVSGTSIDGLVQGSVDKANLTQVLQNAKVEPNQIVVTSGLDDIAPRLVIGRVETVDTNEAGLFQQAVLALPMDIHTLTTVFIVKS